MDFDTGSREIAWSLQPAVAHICELVYSIVNLTGAQGS